MGDWRLRRRCRRLLGSLQIPARPDVPELCAHLAAHRGRPIQLVATDIDVPGPYGLWVAAPAADLVLYQATTTPAHQQHIILHELAHIISDEDPAAAPPDSESEPAVSPELEGLLPELGPELIRRALRRDHLHAAHEREVEAIATILAEWVDVADRTAPGPDEAATGLGAALSDHRGWS